LLDSNRISIIDSWAWKYAETTNQKSNSRFIYMWWAGLGKKWIKDHKFTRTRTHSNTLDWYETVIYKKIITNKKRKK